MVLLEIGQDTSVDRDWDRRAPRMSSKITAVVLGIIIVAVIYIALASTATPGSNTCVISGQPTGMYLSVVSDSNGSAITGAQVTAVHHYGIDDCNGVVYPGATSTSTFTTSGAMWNSLDSDNLGSYTITVQYQGHQFSFSARLEAESVTCAQISLPSGRNNVTVTEFQFGCK